MCLAAVVNDWRTRLAVCQNEKGVVCRSVSIHANGVEGSSRHFVERLLQQRRRDGRVGHHKRQRRGHIRMNHPCALGAAHQVNPLARHFERSGGRFRAGVRGADGQRQFHEGARRGAAVLRERGERSQDFFHRQLHADDPGGAHEHFLGLRAQAPRGFFDGAQRSRLTPGSRRTVGVPGVHHHRPHAPAGELQMLFREHDRRGHDEVLCEDGGRRRGHVA